MTEVPHLKAWAEKARELSIEWTPRIHNLLPTQGIDAPSQMEIVIQKSDRGVAATTKSRIVISSHWIETHPKDFGLVIHEATHVVQAYPNAKPVWLTEGIADYIRWAIYEGKPQRWFPRPTNERGYEKGYRVTAGFLLWLESDKSPGLVKKLNTAMRHGKYTPAMLHREIGRTLDQLWEEYAFPASE